MPESRPEPRVSEEKALETYTRRLFNKMHTSSSESNAQEELFNGLNHFKHLVEQKEAKAQQKKETEANEVTGKLTQDNLILKQAVIKLTQKLDAEKRRNTDVDALQKELLVLRNKNRLLEERVQMLEFVARGPSSQRDYGFDSFGGGPDGLA